jgi:hypothetical protein
MWASGVDLVGWFMLADLPIDESYFQSGLYFHGSTFAAAKPKGFLEGFRFPFVALGRGRSMYVWAHTPFGKPARVIVEQTFKGGWNRVATIRTRAGVAAAVLKVKPIGRFRAVLPSGEKSLPFSVRVPPDRYFNTFGARTLGPNGSCS